MFDKEFDKMFGLSRLGNMLDPKKLEAERRARQQYGACVLGGKCSREGGMCIPCAMTFREVDKP